MSSELPTSEVYIERCELGGKVLTTTEHTVWDRCRFLESQQDAATNENQFIRLITREEYREFKWPAK